MSGTYSWSIERERANLRSLRSWAIGFLTGVVFAATLALAYPDKFAVRVVDRPRLQQDNRPNRPNPTQLKKSVPADVRRMA